MKKRVSLKNLFENGVPCLEMGGTIKFHGKSDNDYDLINDTTQEVIIRNDEQLEFGEWCHDETDGKFIVGTSDSGEKVYFSKEEYELAVSEEEYELAVSEKRTIELGKEYLFAGYRWVPVEINRNCQVAVMQSLGVTAGPWPGFSMENLGDGNHYTHNIDEYDISKYDDKTYALMKQIKPVSLIDGLYLPSFEDINGNQLWKDALARAASRYSSFGASYSYAWTGTYNGYSHVVWIVSSNGGTYGNYQSCSFVVAPVFNLDLSKVEIVGDKIIKNAQPAPSLFEHDDNCHDNQLLGKTYKFAGYDWTVCEVDNKRHAAVIQSHGVTHGAWPGYVMQKFGGKANVIYELDIDGEDISVYDNEMKELYDNIKDAENTSATYGNGLYLISREKAGFTVLVAPDSANYWQALKKAAENACPFESPSCNVWTGTCGGHRSNASIVSSDGRAYYSDQTPSCVVAPTFNLDLSKVEIRGDKIVIRDDEKTQTSQTFGITLIEKPNVDGLTKAEVMEMYDQMDGDEAYPLEIGGSETSVMGFITPEAAEILDYDYEDSGLNDFVAVILDDMNNESEDGTYEFRGIRIHLSR